MDTINIDPCLDERLGGCEGEVEYRIPMSPTGRSFPRCEKHFQDRLDTQDRLAREYGIQRYY